MRLLILKITLTCLLLVLMLLLELLMKELLNIKKLRKIAQRCLMTSEVENFVVKFFQSLGAEVIERGEIVEVNKIPVLVSGGLGIGEKVMFTSSPEKAKEGVILISKASRLRSEEH